MRFVWKSSPSGDYGWHEEDDTRLRGHFFPSSLLTQVCAHCGCMPTSGTALKQCVPIEWFPGSKAWAARADKNAGANLCAVLLTSTAESDDEEKMSDFSLTYGGHIYGAAFV